MPAKMTCSHSGLAPTPGPRFEARKGCSYPSQTPYGKPGVTYRQLIHEGVTGCITSRHRLCVSGQRPLESEPHRTRPDEDVTGGLHGGDAKKCSSILHAYGNLRDDAFTHLDRITWTPQRPLLRWREWEVLGDNRDCLEDRIS